jgi:hypothetical protein
MFKLNQRPVSSAFRGNRKKTFSLKRENEADKYLDDYLKRRYDYLKDQVITSQGQTTS